MFTADDNKIAELTERIRLNPNDAEAYFERGKAYAANKDDDRAIADYSCAIGGYEKAISFDPNDADYYGGKICNFKSAVNEFIKAARLMQAYCVRNVAYICKGDSDKAKSDSEMISRISQAMKKISEKIEKLKKEKKKTFKRKRGDVVCLNKTIKLRN